MPAKTIGKISAGWIAGMKLQHWLFLFQFANNLQSREIDLTDEFWKKSPILYSTMSHTLYRKPSEKLRQYWERRWWGWLNRIFGLQCQASLVWYHPSELHLWYQRHPYVHLTAEASSELFSVHSLSFSFTNDSRLNEYGSRLHLIFLKYKQKRIG